MNPLLLAPLFELGKGLIDRMFPDPAAKAAAELEHSLRNQWLLQERLSPVSGS